jgi:ADP-ribose pyrophosphatase YjhB (NUDIX family)
VRELREETGLDVVAGDVVGRLERPSPGGATYVIDDLACTVVGGVLAAGDDADDARWVTRAQLEAMPLTPDLLETLDGWSALTALR